MSILNNIINEFDIALKTLSDKKAGTDREYPPTPVDKNTSKLSKKEKDLSIQMMRVNPVSYTHLTLPTICSV